MSWIQENKFVAGLAGVTAVISGAILFFGNSQGNAFEQKKTEFEELKSQHTKLEKSRPYPDDGNLKKREGNMEQFATTIKEVSTILERYSPGELASPTPEQFSDAQVKMRDALRMSFKASGTILPEGCGFGFEKYAKVQAKSGATAKLNFQLDAMQSLLEKLAATKPNALLNVVREELPVEKGSVTEPKSSRSGKRKKRTRQKSGASPDSAPYTLMPVELAFTASESAVREFFKGMVSSEKYYYAIRSIRIKNESQKAPTIEDAGFPADGASSGGDDTPFGASDEGGAEAEGKRAVNNSRILKQVLGSEKLHVYISFDIVLLKGGEKQADAPKAADKG